MQALRILREASPNELFATLMADASRARPLTISLTYSLTHSLSELAMVRKLGRLRVSAPLKADECERGRAKERGALALGLEQTPHKSRE